MSANTPSAKVCLKCGYERRAHDAGPAAACPSCGAIYAKVEAAFRKDGPPKAAASAPDNSPTMAVEYIDATRRRMAHVIYLLFALPTGVTALMGYSLAKANRDNYSDEIAAALSPDNRLIALLKDEGAKAKPIAVFAAAN